MGKRYKQKRIKRAYLKRFSAAMVNVGQAPSRDAIPKEFEGIADYRKRGGSFEPIPPTRPTTLGPEGIQGQQSHFVDPLHHISYKEGAYTKLKLFFQGNRWQWVEEDHILKRIRYSIIYKSKARAEQVYLQGRIFYPPKDIIKLPRPG